MRNGELEMNVMSEMSEMSEMRVRQVSKPKISHQVIQAIHPGQAIQPSYCCLYPFKLESVHAMVQQSYHPAGNTCI